MVSLVNIILDSFYSKTMQIIEDIYESEKTFAFSRNDNPFSLESKFKSTKVSYEVSIFQYLIRLPNFMKLSVQSLIQLGEEMYANIVFEKMDKISCKYSPQIPQ